MEKNLRSTLKKITDQDTLAAEVVYIREVDSTDNTCTAQKITDTFNKSPLGSLNTDEYDIQAQDFMYKVPFSLDEVNRIFLPEAETSFGLLLYTDKQRKNGVIIALSSTTELAFTQGNRTTTVAPEYNEDTGAIDLKLTAFDNNNNVITSTRLFGSSMSVTTDSNKGDANWDNNWIKTTCGSVLNVNCDIYILPTGRVRIARSAAQETAKEEVGFTYAVSDRREFGFLYNVLINYLRASIKVTFNGTDATGKIRLKANNFADQTTEQRERAKNYLIEYLTKYLSKDVDNTIQALISDIEDKGIDIDRSGNFARHVKLLLTKLQNFVTYPKDEILIDINTFESFSRFRTLMDNFEQRLIDKETNWDSNVLKDIEVNVVNEADFVLYYIDYIFDSFDALLDTTITQSERTKNIQQFGIDEEIRLQSVLRTGFEDEFDKTEEIKEAAIESKEYNFKDTMDKLLNTLIALKDNVGQLNDSIATYTYINPGGTPTPIVDTAGQAPIITNELITRQNELEEVITDIGELFF